MGSNSTIAQDHQKSGDCSCSQDKEVFHQVQHHETVVAVKIDDETTEVQAFNKLGYFVSSSTHLTLTSATDA